MKTIIKNLSKILIVIVGVVSLSSVVYANTPFATFINALTAKVTPASGDLFYINDSAALGVDKSITFSNLRAAIISGFSGGYPFTPTTNFGANSNATTGIAWFQNGLQASSTSYFGTGITSSKFASNGDLYIGTAIAPLLDGFGTKNYELQILSDVNDINGIAIHNKNTGTTAAGGIFFSNSKSPTSGIGALQTYYGGLIFPGGGWDGLALGLDGANANDLGVYTTDGNLVLGAASSSASNPARVGNIVFNSGAGSLVDEIPDAIFTWDNKFGIGTTSPYAKLSVVGETVSAFYTATTTATSTFAGGVQANILNTTSTTASSTFANGINLTAGCLAIRGTCVTGGGGSGTLTGTGIAGMMSAWTSGTNLIATSTIMANNIIATSTLLSNYFAGFVGMGTSTPGTPLSVTGPGVFTGQVTATNFYATSSTATSTFKGNVRIDGTLDVQNLVQGPIQLGLNNYVVATDATGVVGATSTPTAGQFYATSTTASSTLQGLSINALNIRSTTATSTAANGINLTGGCFSINGTCVSGSGGGGSGTVTTLTAGTGITFSSGATCTTTCTISSTGGAIGGYSNPASSTLITLDLATAATSTTIHYDVGTSNMTLNPINATSSLGAWWWVEISAPLNGLIGSTTISYCNWNGQVNPGSGVVNGLTDKFRLSASASTTLAGVKVQYLQCSLEGTY